MTRGAPPVLAALCVLLGCATDDGAVAPTEAPTSGPSQAEQLLSCPSGVVVTEADRGMAAPGTTLEDVLESWSSGEVRQRAARRALAVVVLTPAQTLNVGATTGVAELVRDPSGGWAADSLTTCRP